MSWGFEKKPGSTNLYYIKFMGQGGEGCQVQNNPDTGRLMTYLVGCRGVPGGVAMGTKQHGRRKSLENNKI